MGRVSILTVSTSLSMLMFASGCGMTGANGTSSPSSDQARYEELRERPSLEETREEYLGIVDELKAMVSAEFPDTPWQPEDAGTGRIENCGALLGEEKIRPKLYRVEMWTLPEVPTSEQGRRILVGFDEIVARHGFETALQSRDHRGLVVADVAGPYEESKLGIAWDKAIVLSGRSGCHLGEKDRGRGTIG